MEKAIKILALALVVSSHSFSQGPATIPEKPEVIFVQGGTFNMGSNQEDDEKPVHIVTVRSYSIGKYEVTVGQYKAFCTATGRVMPEPVPSLGRWLDRHPMVKVNFNDAVSYCNWLGEKYGGDWRLPTEAEWEYAARGGNKSIGYTYSGSDELEKTAWFVDNAGGQTQAVGRKKSNELGIYDMSGNVWEWCKDWYDINGYSQNPKGNTSGSKRVFRGGSWAGIDSSCRAANRDYCDPDWRTTNCGFRVVLSQ